MQAAIVQIGLSDNRAIKDRHSAPDLSGTRYEHFRVLLEDESLWRVLPRRKSQKTSVKL